METPVPQAQPAYLKLGEVADSPSEEKEESRPAADLALVRQVLDGDARAIEVFVRRMSCARRFLAYKSARFGAPLGVHELEDAVQATLLAVWRKLPEYTAVAPLETWVLRFAYLELLGALKLRDRRPEELDPLPEEALPHARDESRLDPFERERLLRGLEWLERDTAELIRLKHLHQCTFEEIAARLAISINTAKTRYYRGMERLRQALQDPRTSARRPG